MWGSVLRLKNCNDESKLGHYILVELQCRMSCCVQQALTTSFVILRLIIISVFVALLLVLIICSITCKGDEFNRWFCCLAHKQIFKDLGAWSWYYFLEILKASDIIDNLHHAQVRDDFVKK